MDPRFVERNLFTAAFSENELVNVKNVMQTPRANKFAFGDKTNKTNDLLRSAKKNVGAEKKSPMGSTILTEEAEEFDWYDLDNWSFPKDKNCYCCGNDRKTDGEVYAEQFQVQHEKFLEHFYSVPLIEKECVTPHSISPFKFDLQELPLSPVSQSQTVRRFNLDSLLDSSSKPNDSQVSEDLDSSLEVPSFDDSSDEEESIIEDW